MRRQIEWCPRAEKDYLRLLDFLLAELGEGVIHKFSDRLHIILDNIIKRPKMYPATDKRDNVRRCVITKQTILYYRVWKNKIELITLFDSRQNPLKRKL